MVKFSWKEILVIFVSAVLATGLSLIYGRMAGCPKINCPAGEICPLIFCVSKYVRGWPIPFWIKFDGFLLPTIIIDFLFYFIIFLLIWIIIKFAIKKFKKET